jgi:hypothetical protein
MMGRHTHGVSQALACSLLSLFSACDTPSGTSEASLSDRSQQNVAVNPTDADIPTYHGAIREFLDTHCTQCHMDGGIGGFSLLSYEMAEGMAEPALHAIDNGLMPPWLPDPDCRHFKGEHIVSQAEKDLFRHWVDGGRPMGEPKDDENNHPVWSTPETAFVPTHVGHASEAYEPSGQLNDDYRCFPLAMEFEEDQYMTASMVVPDTLEQVHHVLIYAISPERVADLEQLDAAEPGPGYTCFGGSEVGTPNPIGAWVPGIDPIVIREGMGIHIRAQSRIVMQIHYNLLAALPQPDLTEWHARFTTAPPDELLESRPFAHRTLAIAAHDSESVQEKIFTNKTDETWQVVSLGPHMHLLGVSLRLDVLHKSGEESCLMDIPRWDFNWQRNYDFLEGEEVFVQPGEQVRLRCVYDNSEVNQPIVDGQKITSTEVLWGDGTLDEMCLSFLTMVTAFDAPPRTCEVFSQCTTGCGDVSDFQCLTQCMASDFDCAFCLIPEVFTDGACLDVACTEEMEEVDTCLLDCASSVLGGGGDIDACLKAQCPEAQSKIDQCASPVLDDGFCDSSFVSCSATL